MIKVRELKKEDAAVICEISEKELGYPCDLELVNRKIAGLNTEREAVFVAEDDGRVCGYIHVEKYDVLYSETMANYLGVSVSKEYQGKGVGRLLIEAAEKWCLENDIHAIRLNSGIQRKYAHGFYEHMGYVCDKEQKRFCKKI